MVITNIASVLLMAGIASIIISFISLEPVGIDDKNMFFTGLSMVAISFVLYLLEFTRIWRVIL